MKVVVIGDVIVDRNVYGTVSRVSPEAPVPVLDVDRVEDQPGGAANVAHNISALGRPDISCNLVAAVGRDPDGAALGSMFDPHVVAVFFVDSSSPTLVKTRLRSSGMQLGPRIDQGKRVTVDPLAMWQRYISATSPEVRAVVVSDYAKGTLQPQQIATLISGCVSAGVAVFVDGKPANMASYAGATVFTPNLREAMEIVAADVHPALAMDCQPIEQGMTAAKLIASRYSIEHVFVTLGQHGAAYASRGGDTKHFAGTSVQPADVTGAGDTFLASLVVSLLRGVSLDDAMLAANTAARLAVQRVGTARVTADELSDELIRMRRGNTKLVTTDEAVSLAARCRRREKLVVFTNGCFDLLHPGHLHLLQEAKAVGDVLIVGLNSDNSVRCLKGDLRPVVNQDDRAKMLSAFDFVDAVVIFDEPSPANLIKAMRPDVLVKGQEYVETQVPGADLVARHGGRVVFVPMLPGFSTTGLMNAQ